MADSRSSTPLSKAAFVLPLTSPSPLVELTCFINRQTLLWKKKKHSGASMGDIVIFPLKRTAEIWLGRVTGEYTYDASESYPTLHRVEWLKKLPRTTFSQGALYEIGSAMSFFQVKNYADEFEAALEGKAVAAPTVEEEDETISVVADDIEQQSRDFVLKQIHQKLKGHGLAEFVGHLLNLMGYKTKVSPPGPDRGIDIRGNKDDLWVTPPTIIVQVKSGEG